MEENVVLLHKNMRTGGFVLREMRRMWCIDGKNCGFFSISPPSGAGWCGLRLGAKWGSMPSAERLRGEGCGQSRAMPSGSRRMRCAL